MIRTHNNRFANCESCLYRVKNVLKELRCSKSKTMELVEPTDVCDIYKNYALMKSKEDINMLKDALRLLSKGD